MELTNTNGKQIKLSKLGVGSLSLFEEYLETTPVDELKESWNKLGLPQRVLKVKEQGKKVIITLEDESGLTDFLTYERK